MRIVRGREETEGAREDGKLKDIDE